MKITISQDGLDTPLPRPRFQVGDWVTTYRHLNSPRGIVVDRSYDNLLHATQWRYKIRWLDGDTTNHHYDYDLRFTKGPR